MFDDFLFLFSFCFLNATFSATETKVPARGKALVPTDLSIGIPEGTYARIGMLIFMCLLLSAVLFGWWENIRKRRA